jgi:uncharacterized protein (TIGR02996 family)
MTLHDETFIQAILENPQEEANRLVYADWLEERGDPRSELYRKRRLTNGIGMEFVLVPRGSFWMGGGRGKRGEKHVEMPHEFYLGVYPVTQGQWQAVMGSNPSHFSRTGRGKRKVKKIADADLQQFPVESVSWEDVQQFIRKLISEKKHRVDGCTACRPRKSGNMLVGVRPVPKKSAPSPSTSIGPPTTSPPRGPTSTAAGPPAARPRGRSWNALRKWAHTNRTALVSTTSTATSGNGRIPLRVRTE